MKHTAARLKNLYKQVFASLCFADQFRVIYRQILATIEANWTQYFLERFEEIGMPISRPEAEKLRNTIYKKARSFFPYSDQAIDAMSTFTLKLTESKWWENLMKDEKFESMGTDDVMRLLVGTKAPQIFKNIWAEEMADKRRVQREIWERPSEEPMSIADELQYRLESPDETMRRWEQEQDDLEWQIIMKDFAKSLEGKERAKYPKINLFKKYFLEGYTLAEIAAQIEEAEGKSVSVSTIGNHIKRLHGDFLKFIKGYGKNKVLQEIIDNWDYS